MYWTVHLHEGGPRRVNHAAASVDDYIYSFGGYCSGDDYKSSYQMDVHILNTHSLRWSLVPLKKDEHGVVLKFPEVPFQRYGHTAIAYDTKVYVWGGRNDEMPCNTLFCFDTKTLSWSKPEVFGNVPGARDGHSSCIIDHYMYIFGGFEDYVDRFSRDVHCLDLHTMTWTYIQTFGEPPSYRDFHTATPINNRIYIFGGRGDMNSPHHSQQEFYSPEIVYLDLKTRRWHMPRTTGNVPVGRRSHSAFAYNNMIYVFGGYNGILDQHFNDLHYFDPELNRWSLLTAPGQAPSARRRQVCIVIGKRVFLFGGTSVDTFESTLIDFSDTHVLDFEPTLKTLAILAVFKNNIDNTWLPHDVRWEMRTMTTPNAISRPLNNTG